MLRGDGAKPVTTALFTLTVLAGAGCGSGSGHAPGSTACQQGPCPPVTLASAQDDAHSIGVSSTDVYWIRHDSQADGAFRSIIVTCPRSGCDGRPRVVASTNGSAALAVDRTNLYWTEDVSGNVMKLPLAGGTPTVVAAGQYGATGIAVDGTNVYWGISATVSTPQSPNPTGALLKAPVNGGSMTTLTSPFDGSVFIATDGTNVYWSDPGQFTTPNSGSINKVSVNGGPTTTLAFGLVGPSSVAVDGSSVYWADGIPATIAGPLAPTGTIMKMPIDGGQPTTIASGLDVATVVVASGRLVWSNRGRSPGSGAVFSLSGTKVTTLAAGQGGPTFIAADADGVFWINSACVAGTQSPCDTNGSVVGLASP